MSPDERVLARLREAVLADGGHGAASFIESTIRTCIDGKRLRGLGTGTRVCRVERWYDREHAPVTVTSERTLDLDALDALGANDPEEVLDELREHGFFDESDPSQPMVLVWAYVPPAHPLPAPGMHADRLHALLHAPRT